MQSQVAVGSHTCPLSCHLGGGGGGGRGRGRPAEEWHCAQTQPLPLPAAKLQDASLGTWVILHVHEVLPLVLDLHEVGAHQKQRVPAGDDLQLRQGDADVAGELQLYWTLHDGTVSGGDSAGPVEPP